MLLTRLGVCCEVAECCCKLRTKLLKVVPRYAARVLVPPALSIRFAGISSAGAVGMSVMLISSPSVSAFLATGVRNRVAGYTQSSIADSGRSDRLSIRMACCDSQVAYSIHARRPLSLRISYSLFALVRCGWLPSCTDGVGDVNAGVECHLIRQRLATFPLCCYSRRHLSRDGV